MTSAPTGPVLRVGGAGVIGVFIAHLHERPHSMSSSSSLPVYRTVLTLLVLLLSTVFPASVATADTQDAPTTIWSLSPAATDEQDKRVSFRFTVAPGDSVEDAVELTNFSDQEVTFQLQAADGIVSESGAFDILRPDMENEAAGNWIELDQEQVTVPADDSVTIPFTLTVPENATPGDQPAGIAAAVSTSDDDDVAMVHRVGTRIHLRVDGDIMPVLNVENLEVDYQQNWNPFAPGTATATWTVRNDGNVRLGAEQLLRSSGAFGIATAEEPGQPIYEVLPGGQTTVRVEQRVLPLFALWSTVELAPQIVGDDEVDAALSNATGQVVTPAIPIPQLLIVAIIAGAIWYVVTRKKRAKKKFAAAVAAAAKQQQAESAKEPDQLQDA